MKILITGVAGFIGFHVATYLAKYNYDIVGIDNLNHYYDIHLKLARLSKLGVTGGKETSLSASKLYPTFFFQQADICDQSTIENLFQIHQFDHVIHLAAQAGVRYSLENPHAYIESNIVGFLNIIEGCRRHYIKHLLYASSSSVYGMNNKIPFHETDNVDHPVSLYAATKKSNELIAYTYSHLYQLATTGLRFFTVYGPWGRPDMAPILFADAILNNKPINVFNHGNMERDFTYIDDIVQGVVNLIDRYPIVEDKPPYRVLNIGNASPTNLMHFIQTLETAIGKPATINLLPMQKGDVKITYADTSSLFSTIGYKPKTRLKDGIDHFVAWFNEYYKVRAE